MKTVTKTPSTLPWQCPTTKFGPLHRIEELVRHYIATNQQNLQMVQQKQEPAYKGPTLPEIRQDPATELKVSAMMDAICHICNKR